MSEFALKENQKRKVIRNTSRNVVVIKKSERKSVIREM